MKKPCIAHSSIPAGAADPAGMQMEARFSDGRRMAASCVVFSVVRTLESFQSPGNLPTRESQEGA